MNDAVVALEDYGLWDKIIYLNPVAGGNAAGLGVPLKHPLNLPSLIYGNPLINTMGVKGDGVGTYINTQMNIDPHIPSLFDVHSASYQNLSTGFNTANGNGRSYGGYSVGQNANSDGTWNNGFCLNGSETNGFCDTPYNLNPAGRMTVNFTGGKNWAGFICNSRTSASRAVVSRNGVIELINTNNLSARTPNLSYTMTVNGRTNLWQRPFFWMGTNAPSNTNWDLGIRTQLDTRYVSLGRFGWFSNGRGLSDSEIAIYNTIVQSAQTAWGRNI